jgi:hypothetical protein
MYNDALIRFNEAICPRLPEGAMPDFKGRPGARIELWCKTCRARSCWTLDEKNNL